MVSYERKIIQNILAYKCNLFAGLFDNGLGLYCLPLK